MKKRTFWLSCLAPAMGLCACATGPATDTSATDTTPIKTVKLRFSPNNGDPNFTIDAPQGQLLSNVPVPKKRGCDFSGWYYNDNLWDPAVEKVEKSSSLTAKWTLAANAFEKDLNADTRAEGTDVRFCSYNTLLPTVGAKLPVDGRDTGLFNMVIEYQPDVIAFQEFNVDWANGFRKVFVGTSYRLISGAENEVKGKTVNCTLAYNSAVLTLVEYDSFPYATSDSTTSRVLTWALFETKDARKHRFIATTTHWALTDEMRLAEAQELGAWIRQMKPKCNVPIIAMGDYNMRDGSDPYFQLVKDADFQDAKYTAEKRGLVGLTHYSGRKTTSYKVENVNTTASIDHIFHTEGMEALYYDTVLNAEILTASDHLPIYADFKFTATP